MLAYFMFLCIAVFYREAVFFGCQKAASYQQAMLEGKQTEDPKWNVVRYHHDPAGEKDAKTVIICQEIPDDVYGLTIHQDTSFQDTSSGAVGRKAAKQSKKKLPTLLTISVQSGFLVVMDPLEEEKELAKRLESRIY